MNHLLPLAVLTGYALGVLAESLTARHWRRTVAP